MSGFDDEDEKMSKTITAKEYNSGIGLVTDLR